MRKTTIFKLALLLSLYLTTTKMALGCSAVITQIGPTSFCSATYALTLKANSGASWQWKKNGVPIAGTLATKQSYKPASTGTYSVVVTDALACSSTSLGVLVNVLPPPIATINTGGPVYICEVPGVALFNKGEACTALILNGNDEYVTVNSFANGVTSLKAPFTVECWAMANNTNTPMSIIGSRSPGEYSFDFKFSGNNKIHGDIGDGSSWYSTSADATLNYIAGRWYHIAYVVRSNGYSVYINGILQGSGTYSVGAPVLFDATHKLTFGNFGSLAVGELLNGGLDELRIWNFARSASQINANKNKVIPVSTAGLVAYYKFDDLQEQWNGIFDSKLSDYSGTFYPSGNYPYLVQSGAEIGPVNMGYLWSNGATTKVIKVDQPGTYSVTVTGSNGCTKRSASLTFDTPAHIQPPTISVDQCIGYDASCACIHGLLTGIGGGDYVNWCCGGFDLGGQYEVFTPGTYFCSAQYSICASASTSIYISACPEQRISEDDLNQVFAYPNPFTNSVTIDIKTNEVLFLQITDISGRIIKTFQNISQSFVLDRNWLAGTYFLNAKNQSGSYNKTLKLTQTE